MLITIDDLLDAPTLDAVRRSLAGGPWDDGRLTAGTLGAQRKSNSQLADGSAQAREAGNLVLRALGGHPTFVSAAMPERIFPPRFARYRDTDGYGTHVDGAVMALPGSGRVLRSDLSATLFLNDPDDYDGGELLVETPFGAQEVKLPAGALVLYPASSLHRVNAVRRGERLVGLTWIQSMVRDDAARSLLFDLDQTVQALTPRLGGTDDELVRLTGVYHNLVRRWAVV